MTRLWGKSNHWAGVLALGLGLSLCAGEGSAQSSLADYDYENLSFRGFSLEWGHIFPTRAESTYTVGTRVDLGVPRTGPALGSQSVLLVLGDEEVGGPGAGTDGG